MQSPDAWKQLYDLRKKYTKTWMVRPDLKVVAHATERCVEFALGEVKRNVKFDMNMMEFKSSGCRNVSTMRELALVLWAAADFVEESNLEWAGHHVELELPERFEGEKWDPKLHLHALPVEEEPIEEAGK